MRVLVTGGAGFIGSHLCEKLLGQGHEVVCLDNFFTGRRENVAHFSDDRGFELVDHDVTEPIFFEVDRIFNLACPASPVHYQHNRVKTVKTNVMGAVNMLELAGKVGARVLQASTSEVYGDPLVHPQSEDYWGNVNPIGPRSCYDEGKRVAETLFTDYHKQNDVDIRIARIFNTYGPRMMKDDGRVVSNFVVQALGGEKLTIYGDGKQTRSFCYVDDLVDGLMALMDSEGEETTTPVNLGNPGEFTMLELAEAVGEISGRDIELEFLALPTDDPRQRRPDIGKAERLLGWRPKTDLREGLGKTIGYFETVLERRSSTSQGR